MTISTPSPAASSARRSPIDVPARIGRAMVRSTTATRMAPNTSRRMSESVLDLAHKADNDPITVEDLKAALAKTGATLTDRTIVLIRTGRDTFMGTKAFWTTGTGMSASATEWLIDQGPTVMGIDQWGWDLPFQ